VRGGGLDLPGDEIARIETYFAPPSYPPAPVADDELTRARAADPAFDRWCRVNLSDHRQPGYGIVSISLKPTGGIPGDISADQMDIVAGLADRFSLGEIRATYVQNLVLPHVRLADLKPLYDALADAGLATANIGLATDMITCPGLDFCNLANARSIPVAQRISELLADPDRLDAIGALRINISGCINACGHHHAGDIGLLGVDRKGVEFYQITLGGRGDGDTAIGSVIGPAFSYDDVVGAVDDVIGTFLERRQDGEDFAETYRRIGPAPFKEQLYGTA